MINRMEKGDEAQRSASFSSSHRHRGAFFVVDDDVRRAMGFRCSMVCGLLVQAAPQIARKIFREDTEIKPTEANIQIKSNYNLTISIKDSGVALHHRL